MSICWYCHWGVAKQVADIYNKYCALITDIGGDAYTAMNYGPAHIVWADENFDKEDHIQWCIDNAQDWMKEWNVSPNFGDDPKLHQKECDLVVESLKELLLLPDEILNCEPEDYDDENPENYRRS